MASSPCRAQKISRTVPVLESSGSRSGSTRSSALPLASEAGNGELSCRFHAGQEDMSEAYIGVDVGTLSARAGVFDCAGRLLASARRPIAVWREPGEIVEQSSDDIWRAVTAPCARRSRRRVCRRGRSRHRLRRDLLAGRARPQCASLVGEPDRCAGARRDRLDGSSRHG